MAHQPENPHMTTEEAARPKLNFGGPLIDQDGKPATCVEISHLGFPPVARIRFDDGVERYVDMDGKRSGTRFWVVEG